jgi:hypothetical protein
VQLDQQCGFFASIFALTLILFDPTIVLVQNRDASQRRGDESLLCPPEHAGGYFLEVRKRKHARMRQVLYAPLGFNGVIRTSYQQDSFRSSQVARYLQQTLGAADMLDGFEAHDRIIGGAIFRQVHRLGRGAYSPVVWFGWPWLLVLVATLVAAIVLRKRPMAEVAIGLSASGLLYLLPYFFCGSQLGF